MNTKEQLTQMSDVLIEYTKNAKEMLELNKDTTTEELEQELIESVEKDIFPKLVSEFDLAFDLLAIANLNEEPKLDETKELIETLGELKLELFKFELKKDINEKIKELEASPIEEIKEQFDFIFRMIDIAEKDAGFSQEILRPFMVKILNHVFTGMKRHSPVKSEELLELVKTY